MEAITGLIEGKIGISSVLQAQIFKSIFLIIIMLVAFRLVKKTLFRTIKNIETYYRIKKLAGYIFVATSFILIGRIWFTGVQSLTTFLGLFSAGLAIAMKDLILNIAGWGFIVWKGPFNVGDRIEISSVTGDVIDIELLQFALMETNNWISADQSTGRIVYIPNSLVFMEPTYNYSRGIPYIWNEIPIHLTFESNWEKAKGILEEIAQEHGGAISEQAEKSIKEASRKYLLFNANLYPKVYTSLDNENSITLTIRYMSFYKMRRDSSEKIYEEVLRKFKNHEDIEFSYPTQRVYDRQREKSDSIE